LSLILESITFGLVIAFMIIGLVGIVIPVLPGMLLIWLATLFFVIVSGFDTLSIGAFAVITLIAFVTGTADFWLSSLSAKRSGASKRSLLLGLVGSIIGTILLPLIGTIIGYGVGILLSEYQQHNDWRGAWKASLGGVAGWGLATAVQLGGALLIIIIFAWQALT
jgi:uncharacterized protein YqgC (DUF456 family)